MIHRVVSLLAAITSAAMAQPTSYVISTLAYGTVVPVNGPSLTTPVGETQGVAVDASGNVFFTNRYSVYKLDGLGIVTRIAGTGIFGDLGDGGPAIYARFKYAGGIALDHAGNIYVADAFAARVRKISTDGIITTIAGNGTACCHNDGAGDGGRATAAQLFVPYQIAVDPAGNVYIGEGNTARIRRVTADGIIQTVAGVGGAPGHSGDGGPAAQAQIGAPWGLAFDPAGNLYFSEAIPGEDIIGPVATYIRKVTLDGIISTIAGSGGVGTSGDGGPALSAQFSMPGSLVATSSGDVYVTDAARLRKISADGTIRTIAGGDRSGFSGDAGPAIQATFSTTAGGQFLGLGIDQFEDLFVADSHNQRIREITNDGITITVAGDGRGACCYDGNLGPNLYAPVGVTADPGGGLYVSDTYNSRIFKFNGDSINTVVGPVGSYLFPPQLFGTPPLGDNGAAILAQISLPAGSAFDASGNLYLADAGDDRIRKIGTDGRISTVAGTGACCFGGDGGPAISAQLTWPEDVAADRSGRIYIADTGDNRIRVVMPDGKIATLAGNGSPGYAGDDGPAAAASLNQPSGVAVDGAGNVYIADTLNFRIRKVAPNGTISTVAGTGLRDANDEGRVPGEGGPAISAQLWLPLGVRVDAADNLYIADGIGVRFVSAAGIISTIAGSGLFGITGDGGPATSASLGAWGLTIDSSGTIYVADPWDSAVRKLTPTKAH